MLKLAKNCELAKSSEYGKNEKILGFAVLILPVLIGVLVCILGIQIAAMDPVLQDFGHLLIAFGGWFSLTMFTDEIIHRKLVRDLENQLRDIKKRLSNNS